MRPHLHPTHVFVLAAGRGSRLGSVGADTPKWLLDVGGQTIADRQLAAVERAQAEAAPIEAVRVITGHAAEEIERYLAARSGNGVSVLHNEEYATLNNWYSVLLALRGLERDPDARVVIVNGDLFADPGWIAAFLADAAGTDAESLIAADLERKLTDESMKVSLDAETGSAVAEIGKVGVERAAGEYVGMLMARGSVLTEFRRALERFVGEDASRDEWYERAVGLTAAAGVRWTIWPTPDGRWVEIDDDSDLHFAKELAGELAR